MLPDRMAIAAIVVVPVGVIRITVAVRSIEAVAQAEAGA